MRTLVTGATGFLGRHVVQVLRSRGDEVVAVARGHERRARGKSAPLALSHLGAELVSCDVLDGEALAAAMKGVEAVLHCAGRVSRDPADAAALQEVNVIGTRKVLDAAKAAGVRRVVIASTSGTVGISEESSFVARETSPTPLHLINHFPYYRTKLFSEQEALGRSETGKFEVLSINPSLLLGPGDVFGSSTSDVRQFLEGSVPAIPAGGISFVDARDAADGMVRALDRGQPGQRYLLGGCNLTMAAFFGRLERVSGVSGPKIRLPRGAAAGKAISSLYDRALSVIGSQSPVDPASVHMGQLTWYIDSTKAERELGWLARDPNETLADTVRDLRGTA